MQANPFSPPRSAVDDVVSEEVAPALWNPGVAASWSLLLSPAFGAFLHMKNWQAMGEHEKAATAKGWMIGTLILLFCLILASSFWADSKPLERLLSFAGMGLLFSWYFSSGKAQMAFVKARYGKAYPRKGWLKPMLLALAVFVGFVAAGTAMMLLAAALNVTPA
ncbi:hypothetical protein [Piscinibacter koreensis]|uniref:Uncharacterized protein n=1 Tax=Piscinibacter koreensis TaxID=2742824 RepID=A0A7Y6NMT0_9BURK|nr:hypothetical protein [Schlegelella koreensis]NUZ06024.1 hypothetical protein [Schlegelella koreensis]